MDLTNRQQKQERWELGSCEFWEECCSAVPDLQYWIQNAKEKAVILNCLIPHPHSLLQIWVMFSSDNLEKKHLNSQQIVE